MLRPGETWAAYVCRECEIEGKDREVQPGHVICWNCSAEGVITARFAGPVAA